MKKTAICLNCSSEISDDFCKSCGQKTSVSRLDLRDIMSDLVSSMINLEGALLKTMRLLFVQPKKVFKGFINGERVNYYSPVKYLFLSLFVAFIVGKLIGFDVMELQEQMDTRPSDQISDKRKLIGQFMAKYINMIILLFPFCLALAGKLFFWNKEVRMIERIAVGFYIAAQFLLLSIIPMLLSKLSPVLFYTQYIISTLYISFAFYSFYKKKSIIIAIIKAFFAAILAIILYFAFAYIVSVMIVNVFEINSI